MSALEHQEPPAKAKLGDRVGPFVAIEFDADHQTQAANLLHADLRGQATAKLLAELVTLTGAVFDQRFLQEVHGRQRGGAAHRVARAGRPVAARGPGHEFTTSHHRAQGHPRGKALGEHHHVGDHAEVLGGEHPAGSSHPGLHLVEDQQDPVLVADAPQRRQKIRQRQQVSALAQDRLHDHRGHILGRHQVREQLFLDAGRVAPVGVEHAWQQGTEVLSVLGLAGGQGQGAQSAAMKAAPKGDDGAAPRVVASQLEGGLDRLGSRVGEKRLPRESLRRRQARRQAVQPLAHGAIAAIVEIGAADVDQLVRLGRDRGGDRGVAVSGGGGGDAGLRIQVDVPVDVLDHAPGGAANEQGVAVDQRWRQERLLMRDAGASLGAGGLDDDLDRPLAQRQRRRHCSASR